MPAPTASKRISRGPIRRFRPPHLAELLRGNRRPQPRRPHILLAGKLTSLAAPGGGEVQMQSTLRALNKAGVQAEFWRPWEQRLADADVLHLFGSEPEHRQTVAEARRQGVPVVLSTIAWFNLASCWREHRSLTRRVVDCAKFVLRANVPQFPSWRRELYQACDLLLPNSTAEADQLVRYFDVPEKKIHVVCNGADERFAEADPRAFARRAGGFHFVLYPGRIEPRKNQLNFLRAMRGTNVPIVILGDAVPGHEDYYAACQQAAGHHVKFLPRREHHDPLLASAYAACGCLVLASWFETPGLVALEAGMSGVPLVLPREGSAEEYFGHRAEYVSPDNLGEIRDKVLRALARPRDPELAQHVRQHYSWRAAARATREAYARLL